MFVDVLEGFERFQMFWTFSKVFGRLEEIFLREDSLVMPFKVQRTRFQFMQKPMALALALALALAFALALALALALVLAFALALRHLI